MLANLSRRLDALIFDWDGTAVPDRTTAAPELVRLLEALLLEGVICAIITGTKFDAIDHQCTRFLSPAAKQKLYVCTNRGSEVYRFSKSGAPLLTYRRQASPAEEQALDRAALRLQDLLAQRGLKTEIISNRLNRRKIDLIPLPKWKDPKKADFAALLHDTEERLSSAGLAGGLAEVLLLAKSSAKDSGLPNSKITSDIKHVEIGLTDKGDSLRWLKTQLIDPGKIPPASIALIGDEFGAVGALEGSDSLMRIPGLEQAIFVSVGPEPGGVPRGVLPLPGGPESFLGLLAKQLTIRGVSEARRSSPMPTADPSWLVEENQFTPSRARELEACFALGNGRVGVRGSLEMPIPISQSDLFIAGIYSEKIPSLPYSEIRFTTPEARPNFYNEIVPFPFPFRFKIRIDGHTLGMASPSLKQFERALDLKKGLLFNSLRFEGENGRITTLRTLRCVSLSDPQLLLQEIQLTCENYSAVVEFNTSMEVSDFHLSYPHLIVERVEQGGQPTELFTFETRASCYKVTIASQCAMDELELITPRHQLTSTPGEPIRIQKRISIFTSREYADPYGAARSHLLQAYDFDEEL
ncbi:MAG: hypothetical protein ACXWP5_10560, partial [Bdellovibrionota bacterium]